MMSDAQTNPPAEAEGEQETTPETVAPEETGGELPPVPEATGTDAGGTGVVNDAGVKPAEPVDTPVTDDDYFHVWTDEKSIVHVKKRGWIGTDYLKFPVGNVDELVSKLGALSSEN